MQINQLFKCRNGRSAKAWKQEFRLKAANIWLKNDKKIECKFCCKKSIFEERNFRNKVFKKSINLVPRSYANRSSDIDILNDVYWLCLRCAQSKELRDSEGFRKLQSASARGGDVFHMKPYYGGIWGNGK